MRRPAELRTPRLRLIVALLVGAWAAALAPPLRAEDASGTPISIGSDARRAGDLVTLGRAVEVDGELGGALVTIGGRARVRGRVAGDAIFFLTSVELEGKGRVDGDLLAVGGDLTFQNGATPGAVKGRIVTIAALEAAFLAELATSPLRSAAVSPLLLSFRLLLLAGWLVAGLLLLFVRPRRVAAAAGFGTGRLVGVTAIGLSAVLTGILLSAFLVTFVPAKPAFFVVALVAAALLAAKVFGLAAVFLLLGRRLARGASRGSLLFGDPSALALGLLVLGLASLVPAAGALVWSVASLAGIGLALKTSFGRALV